ncbi:MAG TPA: hypothetical protein PK718_01655 [Candidatus Methanofastidiosa archaeon]|nr:hypothetical protein [Candidatus Methanofastidiosa archaeon]HPR41235.1 hypothetical protein [Candidatus Methanofastidiosa archaeon]
MGDDAKRSYGWYKHHAWAALALLSIFFAITRFYPEVPERMVYVIVGGLCLYALIAILLTYSHNREHILKNEENTLITDNDDGPEKERLKIEKKRIKAEAKRIKKEESK